MADTRIHSEGIRAGNDAMAALEEMGACYVAGRYYADESTRDLARKHAAERDARWLARRDAFLGRVAMDMGLLDDEAMLALQREGVALDAVDDLDVSYPPHGDDTAFDVEYWRTRAFPVVCGWCSVVLRAGNPDLPVSHGLCASCESKLEGAA